MSYILDALRRADTERDRGQVPGLNAQPAPASAPLAPDRPSPTARWLGLGGVALLAALLAWWLWPGGELPPPVVVGTAAAPAAPAAHVAPAPEPAMAPSPAPVTLPVVVSAPPPAPLPATAAPAPPAVPAAAVVPTAPPAAAAKAAAPAAEARTVALASLSPEQRRDWPPMGIVGAVYSDHPASRFVIVDGQVLREGDAAAPGVTVERIGARSVVLRWRELRVEVPF